MVPIQLTLIFTWKVCNLGLLDGSSPCGAEPGWRFCEWGRAAWCGGMEWDRGQVVRGLAGIGLGYRIVGHSVAGCKERVPYICMAE